MGYRKLRSMEDLFDPEPLEEGAYRVAAKLQARWLFRVKQLTPVAQQPDGASRSEWLASRKGRPPGALRNAWDAPPPVKVGFSVKARVRNDDQIAVHVEYPTMPHVIRRKRAKALRYWKGGQKVFRVEVLHPGTQGTFMLARSARDLREEFKEIAGPEWASAVQASLRT